MSSQRVNVSLPCWRLDSCSLAPVQTGLSWLIRSFTESTFPFLMESPVSSQMSSKSKSTNWMVISFICLRYLKTCQPPCLPAFCGSHWSSLQQWRTLLCNSSLLCSNAKQIIATCKAYKPKWQKFYICNLFLHPVILILWSRWVINN